MKKICSWCKKDMGEVPSETHAECIITHGICAVCLDKLFAELGVELPAFLDNLAAPVVMVDGEGAVKTANRQAKALLQKNLPDIEGNQPGVVFECAYSKLPEGCGKTVHCSGCTIRNSIMDTFRTGRSHLRTPAYLRRGSPDDCKKIAFLISTEKVKEVILLRIDKVGNSEEA